jgi:hypothetical protein
MQTESQAKKTPHENLKHNFECKICLEIPVEPVTTLCGHLYCWGCLFEWVKAKASQKVPCPSCNSEVDINTVIPLYTSMENHNKKDKSIPRRPQPESTPFQPNNAQANNDRFAFYINSLGLNFVFGNANGAAGQLVERMRNFTALVPILIIMFLPYFIELMANIVAIVIPSFTYFRATGNEVTRLSFGKRAHTKTIEGEVEFNNLALMGVAIAVLVVISYVLVKLFRNTRRQ